MRTPTTWQPRQWRTPAAGIGEMPRGGLQVSALMRVLDLEALFLDQPALTSVVVTDDRGHSSCVTRARFFALLTGRLGFGRSLYARQTVGQLPPAESLVLVADTTIADAAQAVLARPVEQRYDDIVVAFDDGSYGAVCVADLFAELAHAYSFDGLHDALTGLANRRLFLDRLRGACAGAEDCASVAVLFVDVDDFKTINDGLGHDVGDEALSIIAARLRAIFPEPATVARLGGDEFAVLVEDVSGHQELVALAEEVVSRLGRPLRVGAGRAPLTASIGVARCERGVSADDLLRNADMAMYAAKRSQKGGFCFYEDGMHAAARAQLELRAALQGALAREEFTVFYQPVVRLADATFVAAEALLRWRRPGVGMTPPDQFIPLCEENGLIVPIGRWVLEQACRAAARWNRDRAGDRITVSVNISPRQLQDPGLVDDVARALAVSRLAPTALVLEITEGVFIEDMGEVLQRLAALKRLGVSIALDDFGAGFSSLAYLSQMPIDVLKLDRSFVGRLGLPGERGMVAGIVALARSLEMISVAEGVETAEQVAELVDAGCRCAQGFHYARPMEAAALAALVAAGNLTPSNATPSIARYEI